nr:chitobiase/beta-hexosaminidase C-terminal domain-containing protein [Lachnospiraceae bacterium]
MRNRKEKWTALLLSGVLGLSGALAVPVSAVAAEEVLLEVTPEEAEALFAAAEEQEEVSGADVESVGIPAQYLANLLGYLPEEYAAEAEELLALGAAKKVTGLRGTMPVEGDVKALVILTEFEDCKFTDEFKQALETRLFANDPRYGTLPGAAVSSVSASDLFPKDSLRGYYQRASYGALNISGEFTEFKAPHNRSWYENSDPKNQDNDKLYQDAVDAWAQEIMKKNPEDSGLTDMEFLDQHLAPFDLNHDYEIDSCCLACAGGNNGWGNQWWAYRGDNSKVTIGSYEIPSIIQVVDTVHETSQQDEVGDYLETFIHEVGHQLGLDDYYSYGQLGVKKVYGPAMMSSNSCDQDGFAKMLLGWAPKDHVWIITDQKVYNPKEETWQPYTGTCTQALEPYAETGDMAIILPQEDYDRDPDHIYFQFILAEYYKNTENDMLSKDGLYTIYDENNKEKKVPLPEGLRFFRVYALLDNEGNAFAASNPQDSHIPMISDYRNEEEETLGVFRPDMDPAEELTRTSNPSSSFLYNPNNDGRWENSQMVDSGIDIFGITKDGSGNISFNVRFSDTSRQAPQITSAELLYDVNAGDYVKVIFDRPVNAVEGKTAAAIYDYNAVNKTYDPDEKWGELTISRSTHGSFNSNPNELYFLIKQGEARHTKGLLRIPSGVVSSDQGVDAFALEAIVTGYPEDGVRLAASNEGGVYDAESLDIAISVSSGDAKKVDKIYYTLDGTEPSASSTLYSGAFKVDSNCVLKAIALNSNGDVVSERLRESYTLESICFDREGKPSELSITLDVGEAFRVVPSVSSHGDETPKVRYESKDPEKIFVDEDGLVIASAETGDTPVDVYVYTPNTREAAATLKVTVKKGSAQAVRDALIEAYGLKLAGNKMRELAKDLNGAVTMAEFAEQFMQTQWIASIPDQTYTGTAIKPSVKVYDGVKVVDAKNYSVSYKKNTKVGTGEVNVRFKGEMKQKAGNKPIGNYFNITPAVLGTNLLLQNMGVKYNGKLQKPKPILLWEATGKKQAFSAANFTITYWDANDEVVQGV